MSTFVPSPLPADPPPPATARSPWWALTLAACAALASLAAPAAAIDPDTMRTRGWAETDFTRSDVDFAEIEAGGPPKDGIPSIDDPVFRPARALSDMPDREPLIRLEIGGELRGYPLRVLTWHEIVNDTVNGVPVAVTYCPLCNAALVFRREVQGRPTTFGTTGLLRNSDLVMYDRLTESWWQQFTGRAIVGARTGDRLAMIPSRIVSFGDFRAEAPEAPVLVPNDPDLRPYGRNPYVGYDTAGQPTFFSGEMPPGIEPMTRVVAIKEADRPVAVALPLLAEKGEVRVGDVTLTWRSGVASALDSDRIAAGRDVGLVTATRRDATGRRVDVVHDITFAFAFHAFHPEGRIVTRQ